MKYQCDNCDMGVTGLTCSKCNTVLVNDHITLDGNDVQVSKCPKCSGMIKSPQCCGADMEAVA